MFTSEFSYDLPPERIAQVPLAKRDASRLLVVKKKQKKIIHSYFYNLTDFIDDKFLVVINNTRVFPARMYGRKPTGGKVEVLLIRPKTQTVWEALVHPIRSIKQNSAIRLNGVDEPIIIGKRLHTDRREVWFESGSNPLDVAKQTGSLPLPPYIKRQVFNKKYDELDRSRYQTIFATNEGSIAAPTASLHFDANTLIQFKNKQIKLAEITLHVGPGTFLPIKCEMIKNHQMEYEWYSVSETNAEQINRFIMENKQILPVGTTVVRTLESIADSSGCISGTNGSTDLFIYPGYKFRIVKHMLTNFHLPKSTLFMLVCSLAGKDLIMQAYNEAIEKKYRFYSYGDAMLILDE